MPRKRPTRRTLPPVQQAVYDSVMAQYREKRLLDSTGTLVKSRTAAERRALSEAGVDPDAPVPDDRGDHGGF